MKRTENEKKSIRNRKCMATVMILTFMLLSSCTFPFMGNNGGEGAGSSAEANRADTGFVVTGPASFDSADTAVLVDRDEKENTVTFLNLDVGKQYTLSMDGTTRLYDKYGDAVSLEQIEKGDIVDITFLKSKKHLTTMQLSVNSWSFTDVEWYELDALRGEVSIGPETYKLTSNTQYLSEGRNVEIMDLNPADVLSFQGIGNQILSVRVEKGHGYLRLANDEHFVGGWIEIGQSLIQRITEDMLLLVPEGSYEVTISNKGGGGVKNIIVTRNQETTLDIGDLEVPEPQTGMVLFSVNPASTEVYIDGNEIDASVPVTLEYGLHQLIARAEGYQSVTKYIRVAQESAACDVVLEAVGDTEEEEEEPAVTPTPGPEDTVTDYYRVHVDAPEGVEVYLDGNYVGISPCSFRKYSGSHIITLRKSGYETRSYTIQVDKEEKDVSYSFADLERFVSGSSNSSGSSNTTGSDNTTGSSNSGK
nr:PEGA domain-containing protein [uncultured Acetatifactor sp.]